MLSDGKKLNNGDKLRKNPEIKINFTNNLTSKSISDTTQLFLKLNDIYVPYFVKGSENPVVNSLVTDNSTNENKSIIFYPELKDGNNKLSVVYKTNSVDSDTLVYDVIVNDLYGITELYNYPNPMRTETNFIFNLSGSESVVNSKIKIYTVSGKIIREIDYPANAGSNQISWDGKDNDGDFIANGTYLYKLVIDNELNIETKIQKLVVLR